MISNHSTVQHTATAMDTFKATKVSLITVACLFVVVLLLCVFFVVIYVYMLCLMVVFL